jgi:hypothetical protein
VPSRSSSDPRWITKVLGSGCMLARSPGWRPYLGRTRESTNLGGPVTRVELLHQTTEHRIPRRPSPIVGRAEDGSRLGRSGLHLNPVLVAKSLVVISPMTRGRGGCTKRSAHVGFNRVIALPVVAPEPGWCPKLNSGLLFDDMA